MEFCKVIKKIDFFGKEPQFYLNGKPKLTSWFGRIFTFIYIIVYIIIFCYKLIRMYQRVDITFYDSYSNTDEVPKIRITSDNFSLVFAVFDESGNPFVDESIYSPIAYFKGDEELDIKIEVCNPDTINKKYKDYLKGYDLNNFYCINELDYTFEPYINSLIVEIYPCKNDTDNDDNQCESQEMIDEALDEHVFMVYFEDIILTPLNYDVPKKERINYLSSDIYSDLGQYLYTELQIVRIETSTNIIGFEFLSESRLEEFVKFDKELSYSFPYHLDDEEYDEYPINVFEIQLNDKVLSEKRQYMKLIDVLGEIGGLMEMIYSLFGVICSLIVDLLYRRKITNSLFSFNIDKKLILIKENKEYKEHKESQVSEIQFNNDKNIEDEDITEKKLFKKSRRKTFKKKDVSKEDIMIVKRNNRIISNRNSGKLLNFDLSEKKMNKEKHNKIDSDMLNNTTMIHKKDIYSGIITKISLKDLLISICSCGKRNKKKIYRILINESMNIIRNKLDIINIFRNLCSIEHSNNNLNLSKNSNIIKMTKSCINDLSEIIE